MDVVAMANEVVLEIVAKENEWNEADDGPDTAESLIEQVFEVWEAFDPFPEPGCCPGCGAEVKDGIGGSGGAGHQGWCWFGRAEKWLARDDR